MSGLQPVRGTRDLIGEECRRFRYIARTAAEILALYGFQEIETPLLESSAVFLRTLGETSDVVSKQMYVFTDRGGDEVTLRPEGTAGVARAFISEGLGQHLPLKLFYSGPMFRYERPQKGRYRQFQQFGVELLGVDNVQADIEVISAASRVLRTLKVDHLTQLQINTIGDTESREAYRQSLVAYLRGHVDRLSEDSRTRLEKNPLRILDSKDEGDRAVLKDAPLFSNFLNEASRAFFAELQEGLTRLGISYVVDPMLVRGLDYYCHTVFEFTTNAIGSQNAVIAGGRYDGLIKSMGGPHTPGVGWAAGTDRLALILPDLPALPKPVAIVPLGEAAERKALELADQLRAVGLVTDVGYSGNMSKRMKRADKLGARWAVILGDTELAKGVAQVKDLTQGTQEEVPLSNLTTRLR
ncbi:MAG: histidine--tRNA ligase [Bdellovibrionaceae bacterium]|nr:histidine--tRNA ligase [Pseudobdellovibrionaceae bacterium]